MNFGEPQRLWGQVVSNAHELKILLEEKVLGLEAYQHPLGFKYIVLTEGQPQTQSKPTITRLHFWTSSPRSLDSLGELHDHIWDLRSLVVRGRIENRLYRYRTSATGSYIASRISHTKAVLELGRCDLYEISREFVEEGSSYEFPAGTLHLNTIPPEGAITLVECRIVPDRAMTGPMVIRRVGAPAEVATAHARRPLNAEEIRELVHNLCRCVNCP